MYAQIITRTIVTIIYQQSKWHSVLLIDVMRIRSIAPPILPYVLRRRH